MSLTIQSALETYVNITEEIKEHRKQIKQLNETRSKMEQFIKEYLKQTEHPGLSFQGRQIFLDEKQHKQRLKKQDERNRLIQILRSHGVSDPEGATEEILIKTQVPVQKLIMKTDIH